MFCSRTQNHTIQLWGLNPHYLDAGSKALLQGYHAPLRFESVFISYRNKYSSNYFTFNSLSTVIGSSRQNFLR